MTLLRSRRRSGPRHQRGAIAVMFGILLFVLLAAAGLVIDLGHLYVLKSELQNGADSAALAGAKEINLRTDGITAAAQKALQFSQQNKFDFANALVLTNSNLSFSSAPDGPWVSVAEAQASPANKTFIRVDTGDKTVPTYLMKVSGRTSMTTAGVAVAGRFVVDITPLAVCAVDPLNRLGARAFGLEKELLEFGFRRGTTYDMLQLKNIAGTSDPMLINPVDSPPTACSASNSSANFTAPFLCQGNSAVTNNATTVYANTGVSSGPVEKALNSRFNDYSGGSPCIPASAPPDRNVKEFFFDSTVDWMSPTQLAQSQVIDAATGKPSTALQASNKQGVLWTYSRPVRALGSPGSYSAGSALATTDWNALYNGAGASAAYPAGSGASPYAETSGAHFQAPATNTPTNNRRLMNLAIVDCTIPAGSGACKTVPLLGIGRFFLQRKAALTGPNKGLWVEFSGLIEPVPNSEIKLYR